MISLIKDLYSTSSLSDSSASKRHNGGNKTHQKFSPFPSPNLTTKDS